MYQCIILSYNWSFDIDHIQIGAITRATATTAITVHEHMYGVLETYHRSSLIRITIISDTTANHVRHVFVCFWNLDSLLYNTRKLYSRMKLNEIYIFIHLPIRSMVLNMLLRCEWCACADFHVVAFPSRLETLETLIVPCLNDCEYHPSDSTVSFCVGLNGLVREVILIVRI